MVTKRLTADKRPTDVSVVLAYLTELDDFASRGMIRLATGFPHTRMNAAIAHLKKHHIIDCIVVNKDELWFYATPANDDRTRVQTHTLNGITKPRAVRRQVK